MAELAERDRLEVAVDLAARFSVSESLGGRVLCTFLARHAECPTRPSGDAQAHLTR